MNSIDGYIIGFAGTRRLIRTRVRKGPWNDNKGETDSHPLEFDIVQRGHSPWRVEVVVRIAVEGSKISWGWILLLFAAFMDEKCLCYLGSIPR